MKTAPHLDEARDDGMRAVVQFHEQSTQSKMSKSLATQEAQLTIQPPPPSVASMLSAVIEKGITAENVAAMEQLVGLYERMEAKNAEKEFAAAFVALQSEMPGVLAKKIVPDKQGGIKYKYAPYDEIMETVQPMLEKHGFSVTFNMSFSDGRIKSICTLMHTGGHSRTNEFAVRIGGGPPGASETQADGAAKTYAKRGALSDALNIVIDHDDDARAEGKPITQQQANNLRERVKNTGSDEVKFLAFARAETFEDIMDSRFDALDGFLLQKEKANPKPIERDEKGGRREPGETGETLFK